MRQKRPEKLNEQEAAAWDSYDQQYDRYERIADALQPPKDYGIDPAKWRECLIELLASYGCDWLSWMLDRYGNVVGESITSAIEKSTADLARVTAERDGLAKVVERLPKTADGVPITYGMKVWFYDEEAKQQCGFSGAWVECTIHSIYAKNFSDYRGDVTVGVSTDWEGGNLEIYSSLEAAIASLPDSCAAARAASDQPAGSGG